MDVPTDLQEWTPPAAAAAPPSVAPEKALITPPTDLQEWTPPPVAAATPMAPPSDLQEWTPPEQDTFTSALGKRFRNAGRSISALPEQLGLVLNEPWVPSKGYSDATDAYIEQTKKSVATRLKEQEAVNLDRGSLAGVGDAVIGGAVSYAPALAAGILNPALGVAVASTQSMAEQYAESRFVRKRTPGQSLADATLTSAVTGATMMLPIGAQAATDSMKKSIVSSALGTTAQGALMSTYHQLYNSGVFGDDIPLADALKNIAYDSLTMGISGGILAPVLHPLGRALAVNKINRAYEPYIRNIEGQRLTDNELATASQIYPPMEGDVNASPAEQMQNSLNLLTEKMLQDKAEQLLPLGKTLSPKHQELLDNVQAQIADYKELAKNRVDKGGQLTLPLEGLSETQQVTPETAPDVNKAVASLPQYTPDSPHDEVTHTNQLPLGINYPITADGQATKDWTSTAMNLHNMLPEGTKIEMNSWTNQSNPKGLVNASKLALEDPNYRSGLQKMLERFFPNTDYVPLFIGTRGADAATHQVANQEFIRGSLSPLIATQFTGTHGEGLTNRVSLVWVPKKDVAWVSGNPSYQGEFEVAAKNQNAKFQGWTHWKDVQQASQIGESHVMAQTYQNIKDATVATKGTGDKKSWQYDIPLQQVIPGMHPQEVAPQQIQLPDQLEMNLQPGLFDDLPLLPQEKIVMSADKPAVLYPEEAPVMKPEIGGEEAFKNLYSLFDMPITQYKNWKHDQQQLINSTTLSKLLKPEHIQKLVSDTVTWAFLHKQTGDLAPLWDSTINGLNYLHMDAPLTHPETLAETGLAKTSMAKNMDEAMQMLEDPATFHGVIMEKAKEVLGEQTYNEAINHGYEQIANTSIAALGKAAEHLPAEDLKALVNNYLNTKMKFGMPVKAAKLEVSSVTKDMTMEDLHSLEDITKGAIGRDGKPWDAGKLKPGKVDIIGTAGMKVQDAAVHLEKGMGGLKLLEAHLNAALQKFLPDTHVVLQLGQKIGNVAAHYANAGELHLIHLGITPGKKLSLAKAWTSISHEVGHIILDTEFQKAPDAIRNAVHEAYIEWRQTADGMNVIDFVKSAGNLYDIPNAKAFPLGVKDYYYSAADGPEYWLSMDEWFAQQVSRALVKDFHAGRGINDKPMSSIQQFFQTVAGKLKDWLRYFRTRGLTPGDFKPAQAVGEFLHSVDGNTALQVPMYSREFQRGDSRKQVQPQSLGAAQMAKLLQFIKHNKARELSAGLDKYNWGIRHTYTLLQLAEENAHVPGMTHYKEATESWHREKMNWIGRADKRIREWMSLGTEQSANVGKVLFELSNMDHNPSLDEMRTLLQNSHVNAAGANILSNITSDFQDMLQTHRDIQYADAMRLLQGPELTKALTEIDHQHLLMSSRPYFPHTWFGDYTTIVRDKATNKIVHMEAYPTQIMRDTDSARVNRQFNSKDFTVWRSKIAEDMKSMQGLSPLLINQLKKSMNLTPAQEKELEQVLYAYSPNRSFKHHFENRAGTEGYSLDALRAYGEYFLKGANHIGRLKFGWKMEDAIGDVRKSIGELAKAGSNINVTKRVQLQEHLQRHFEYVSHPKNELQALKSLGFFWYLGLGVKGAVVNTTQVPMVTLPFLSGLYGDRKATTELAKAYLDVRKTYNTNDLYTKPQDAQLWQAIQRGVADGFLDEGLASDLASVAEGNFMSKVLPRDTGVKLVRHAESVMSYMFRASEKLNRRVSFQAAYRLAQAHAGHPYLTGLRSENPTLVDSLTKAGFDPAAVDSYLAGKHAVQTTQGEYAAWNKASLFQGKKGALFLFMNYIQMMLHLMNPAGRNPGAGRMLLSMLVAGGVMGLPFAQDINSLIKGAAHLFGKNFNPEMELRQLIVKLGSDHPDVFLNGASRYGFGIPQLAEAVGIPIPSVDLSGSISMGRIIPGMEALTAPTDFDTKVADSVSQSGGALVGIAANLVKAMTDDNPDTFLRWNRAMPVFMRQIWKAYNASASGGVYNRNGAKLMGPDPHDQLSAAEETLMGLGFPLTRMSQKWDLQRAQLETGLFWKAKRDSLLQKWTWSKLTDQPEGAKAAHADIVNFNAETPIPMMRINFQTLYQSIVAKRRVKNLQEAGLAPNRSMAQIYRETQAAFPEVQVERIGK